jgi:hypothetical protein
MEVILKDEMKIKKGVKLPFLFSSGLDFFDYFGVQEGRDVSHSV